MIGFQPLRALKVTRKYCILMFILKYGSHRQKAKH